jgi:hypothetical protein
MTLFLWHSLFFFKNNKRGQFCLLFKCFWIFTNYYYQEPRLSSKKKLFCNHNYKNLPILYPLLKKKQKDPNVYGSIENSGVGDQRWKFCNSSNSAGVDKLRFGIGFFDSTNFGGGTPANQKNLWTPSNCKTFEQSFPFRSAKLQNFHEPERGVTFGSA